MEVKNIVNKINKYYKDKSTTNTALLDATKVNTENFNGRKLRLMNDNE